METYGGNSGTQAIDLAGRPRELRDQGNRLGPHDRAGGARLTGCTSRAASARRRIRGRSQQTILQHRERSGSHVPVRLLYSSRTLADVIYRRERDQYRDAAQVSYPRTRSQPPGWTGHSGRMDAAMLAGIAWPASQHPLAFLSGPTRLVETVAEKLVALGYPPGLVKTERFGGS